ncbi:MAG TPA: sugar ABC transporter permease [Trebonia sp.]|jgi:raffinose/stachyose/melibiose transport system permease protein|nr:sugar ABC transporter permease [Trebonia sp.]
MTPTSVSHRSERLGQATGGSHRPAARARRRRPGHRQLHEFLMALPGAVLFLGLIGVPVVLMVVFSFTNWNGLSGERLFNGFANYTTAFRDPTLLHAYEISVIIAVVGVLLLDAAGLALALAVAGSSRANFVYRTALFYPFILSAVAVGFLWSALLSYDGAANAVLHALGFAPVQFLGTPVLALASVTAVSVWQLLGFSVVVMVAGLQTVPAELLDAARVDGASRRQTFRHVTLPLIAPTVTFNSVIVLVFLLRSYDIVVALTGGGPAGATETVAYKIINDAFSQGQLGYGSAQSVLLIVVTALVAFAALALRRRDRAAGGAR